MRFGHGEAMDVLLVQHGDGGTRLPQMFSYTPFVVHQADSLKVAIGRLETGRIDVVLVDLSVEREPGFDTLRSALGEGRVPIVALTEVDDAEPQMSALAEGAHEYLAKDELHPALVTRCLRYAMDRHRLEGELERLAHGDHLTGLRNRRYWFKALDSAFAASRRHGHPLTLAVCDVDRFKQVNDTYGHSVGDEMLQLVAEVLRSGLRAEDTAARYGGDEFCVLLPHVDEHGAWQAVGRLHAQLERRAVTLTDGQRLHASVTFGVAQLSSRHPSSQALFDAADASLYRNKATGHGGSEVRAI